MRILRPIGLPRLAKASARLIVLTIVSQFLALPSFARSQCAEIQAQKYIAALEQISSYPRFMGRPWTSCSGGCVDVANLNYAALNRMGFNNLKVILVDSSKSLKGAPERHVWHMFLADSLTCDEEIIIDPSFKQFFSGANELLGSDIFVGTREDLEIFFSKNLNSIAMSNGEKTTRSREPDPKATCEKIYGYGRGSRQYLSFVQTRKNVDEREYWKACESFLDGHLKTNGSE